MNLLRRTDLNKFSMPSIQIPKVICRRCKKPVDNVVVKSSGTLEIRCHHQKRDVFVSTLDPSRFTYNPVLTVFEPASERGKDVRKRLSARRNGWRLAE